MILVLATVVMLIPIAGVAYVVFDVIHEMRTERRTQVARAHTRGAAYRSFGEPH